MPGLVPGIPLRKALLCPLIVIAGSSPAMTSHRSTISATLPRYVVVRTRVKPRHARRPRMPIRLHPALEDLIVAFSTTIGAYLIASQFGWVIWG